MTCNCLQFNGLKQPHDKQCSVYGMLRGCVLAAFGTQRFVVYVKVDKLTNMHEYCAHQPRRTFNFVYKRVIPMRFRRNMPQNTMFMHAFAINMVNMRVKQHYIAICVKNPTRKQFSENEKKGRKGPGSNFNLFPEIEPCDARAFAN